MLAGPCYPYADGGTGRGKDPNPFVDPLQERIQHIGGGFPEKGGEDGKIWGQGNSRRRQHVPQDLPMRTIGRKDIAAEEGREEIRHF
jgi:hypothetical protein